MIINTLICGLGQIGMMYDYKSYHIISHCKNIKLNKNFKLVGGVDRKKKQRDLFKKKYKTSTYKDITQAVNKTNPELIIFSYEIRNIFFLKKILQNKSLKFIVFEKPFLISNKDFSKLEIMLRKLNILFFVNFNRNYIKEYNEIKKIIHDKTLGKLKYVKFKSSRNFLSNFSHFLFLFVEYFDEELKYTEKKNNELNFNSQNINVSLKELSSLNYFFFNLNLYFDNGLIKIYGPPDKIEVLKGSLDKTYLNQNNLKLIKKKDLDVKLNGIYDLIISVKNKKIKNKNNHKNIKKYLNLMNKIVNK